MTFNWRSLPFREIWAVDFEFHPGTGRNHGGRDGDLSTPICLAALELRSSKKIIMWRDQFGPVPPYPTDEDSLFLAFYSSAEFGCHQALGWPEPARSLDAYLEFRHFTNSATESAADHGQGFYSLAGALRYFGTDQLDTLHKKEIRDLILGGGPFSSNQKQEILDYCFSDVEALDRLFPHIAATIPNWDAAHFRARYMWAIAEQERRGVPVDLKTLELLRERWQDLRLGLVHALDGPFGFYEVVEGVPHFRTHLFEAFIERTKIAWPRLASGAYDLTAATFEDMSTLYPALGPARELRASLASLRLNSLAVGSDGRNRAMLSPYGTKTGRNTPRASQFVFGPSKWIRSMITPPPGTALIHRDYQQQEVRIAAVLSEDPELLAACESGDIYLTAAKQLGYAPRDATPESHSDIRSKFKTVILGISYGLGAHSLAARIGVSKFEADEILARLWARYRRFKDYMHRVEDFTGLNLYAVTQLGWQMRCPPGSNPRTLKNFPMQSTGAEILHLASIYAPDMGVKICAPVHDAIMTESSVEEVEEASIKLDRLMRWAGARLLNGYELPTDVQVIRPGERFYDKRGIIMWDTVKKLLAEKSN